MKIPIGRAGSAIEVSFRAGDGPLTLYSATVAPAGTQGNTTAPPTPLTFGGAPGFSATARQRITSDALTFPVSFNEELYVSFDVDGSLSVSAIMGFPDSYSWAGSYADVMAPPAGTPWPQATGVDTIDVLAPPQRVFVAMGDSITEGYVDGDVNVYTGRADDYRNAWTTVAQRLLQLPIANAAVSGQGIDGATSYLPAEVFTLRGVSDCIALIGTNDLWSYPPEQLQPLLQTFIDDLQPFCKVWMGTLLPKEKTSAGDLPTVNARRQLVNAWIRTSALRLAGVVDFESAVAVPGDPNTFQVGLTSDGIHPSIEGDAVLGQFAADQFSPPHLTQISPPSGPADGGTAIAISGDHFRVGAQVLVGGLSAGSVVVSSSTSVTAVTPAGPEGTQDVSVVNPDGQTATLAQAFSWIGASPQLGRCEPSDGPTDGGTLVTVEGSGFQQGIQVQLEGAWVQGVSMISDSILTFSSPAHAPGSAGLVVVAPDGKQAALTGCFEYTDDSSAPRAVVAQIPASDAGPSPNTIQVPRRACDAVGGATFLWAAAFLLPALRRRSKKSKRYLA